MMGNGVIALVVRHLMLSGDQAEIPTGTARRRILVQIEQLHFCLPALMSKSASKRTAPQ
jgi:hypothetical protein